MQPNNLLDDGKPQSGSARLPRTRLVHPIKPVKDMGQIFRWNAHTGIGDIQNGVAPALMQGDRDFSAIRRIL